MRYEPHDYQAYAERRVLDQPAIGLFLDMGLGKTVVTLTALNELCRDRFEVARVLVIAPLRVAQDTWPREVAKWDHLRDLQVISVTGTEKQRLRALTADADVFVINRENVAWLVRHYGRNLKTEWPFDMIVVDELSSFKSPSAQRFRALRKVRPLACRFVGLTGTPAPKGYIDLWSQIYLLDRGERLGQTFGEYKRRYFQPGRMDPRTNVVYDWQLQDGAKEKIDAALQDLCISMTAADWIKMPERIDVTTPVVFDEVQRKLYKKLEKDLLISIGGDIITAATAAAATNKLQQFAQGAAYNDEGEGSWTEIHTAKLEALDDILEAANGKPVLLFYWYKHDLARLRARYPHARTLNTPKDISDWNAGNVELMLAHPASAGHGLNLQESGCHAVWFSLTWDLELYQQANARLHRQGQTRSVTVQHLVVDGTVDEHIMKALEGKAVTQATLIEALRARIHANC